MWGSHPLVMIIFYLLNIRFLLDIGHITNLTYVQSIIFNCTVVEGKYIILSYSILFYSDSELKPLTAGRRSLNLWKYLPSAYYACTVNEGPVRIQYKCPVPIYVFPEMKLCSLVISKTDHNVLAYNLHIHVSMSDLFIPMNSLLVPRTDCGNV